MDSTRSLGVSQGPVPGSSEKGNSCANSGLLTWGVNLSFFLALGVMFGRYGWFSGSSRRGTLFYTLGRLDQLREPRLHGARLKIMVARGRGTRGAHATGRGPRRLADFFGPMA